MNAELEMEEPLHLPAVLAGAFVHLLLGKVPACPEPPLGAHHRAPPTPPYCRSPASLGASPAHAQVHLIFITGCRTHHLKPAAYRKTRSLPLEVYILLIEEFKAEPCSLAISGSHSGQTYLGVSKCFPASPPLTSQAIDFFSPF